MTELASPKTKTILIADDDETIQDFFEMALGREGFQVLSVDSGKAALDYLKGNANRKVDLLILDLMMPGTGGYDVLKVRQADQGHLVVWGDEWITYDSEWSSHPEYQVAQFWVNSIKWLTVARVCQVPAVYL